MACEINNSYGKIIISNDVLGTIAGLAATECFGVVGMASQNIKDGLGKILGKESISKGVEVITKDNAIVIKLHIVVVYGCKISEVANNVVQRVQYAVEKNAGIIPSTVQVIVQDVRMLD